jgi:N6-adenosine-specific RNA methylase IME4
VILQDGPFAGLTANSYKTILVDPPWTYETYSDKGKGRSAETHYSCLSLDDLKRLPVADLAAKDCALFCWIIDTHLEHYLELMKAWGFKYKTKAFTWAKTNADGTFFTGMGHWTRSNPEDCLLSTRGHPSRVARDVRRLIVAPRREHSRKPDEIYERIERLVDGPYCELFARQRKAGWASWGNQIDKFTPSDVQQFEDVL